MPAHDSHRRLLPIAVVAATTITVCCFDVREEDEKEMNKSSDEQFKLKIMDALAAAIIRQQQRRIQNALQRRQQ